MRLHKRSLMVLMAVIVVLMLLGKSSQTSAQIVNGGFEDPLNMNGWNVYVQSGSGEGSAQVGLDSAASEGLQCAMLQALAKARPGYEDSVAAHLSQTFSATAGQSVLFNLCVPSRSVWHMGGDGGELRGMGQANLWVELSGSGGYDEGFYAEYSSEYAAYTFPAFVIDGSYTLSFMAEALARDNGAPNSGCWNSEVIANIDNVQLVPEPGALVLLGLGALGFLGWAWRSRKQT